MLADRLRRRKLALALLAGVLVGTVAGLFLPIRAAQPPKPDAGNWSLPNAQALSRVRDDEFRRLRNARFWGELATPGRRSQQVQSSWTLHGIVTRPYVQVAVSQAGKPAQTWVRLGGTLPDGATLVQASRDSVVYDKDGCMRRRALYRINPAEADPAVRGCADAVGSEPAAPPPPASPATPPLPPTGQSGAPSARPSAAMTKTP